MATYIAIVRIEQEDWYSASFPDFPGCVAEAPTLEALMANAREALLLHLERLLDANQRICSPTAADRIDREGVLLLAAIEIPDDFQMARVELAIPALSLARIDALAGRHGMTRATLLIEAVNRWSLHETAPRERRGSGGASDGPTLFDFQNPLELRVDKLATDIDAAAREGHVPASQGASEDITAELAKLFDHPPETEQAELDAEAEEIRPDRKPT